MVQIEYTLGDRTLLKYQVVENHPFGVLDLFLKAVRLVSPDDAHHIKVKYSSTVTIREIEQDEIAPLGSPLG